MNHTRVPLIMICVLAACEYSTAPEGGRNRGTEPPLPAMVEVTGRYVSAEAGDRWLRHFVSLGAPMEQGIPSLHVVAPGETPPPECPGSVEDPTALAGNLCVYEESRTNVGWFRITFEPGDEYLARPAGFMVEATSEREGRLAVSGTYAVKLVPNQ